MRRRVGLFFMIGLAFPLVDAAGASAQGSTLLVSPKTANPGQAVTVTGTTFASSGASAVSIRLSTRDGQVLAQAVPDISGQISATFPIPASLGPGTYLLLATQITTVNGRQRASTPGRTTLRVAGSRASRAAARTLAPVRVRPRGGSAPALTRAVAVFPAQGELRVSENFRLNSDPNPFRGSDQVGLTADPGNPQHIVEVHADYLNSTCEGTASVDGGATWSPAAPLPLPTAGALQDPFVPSCQSFQSVEFGTGQNVYATAVAQRQGPGFLRDRSTLVYKSTDGGMSWQPGVVAMEGGPGSQTGLSGPHYFRPSLSVQRGAGPGNADRIYVVAGEVTGIGKSCGRTCRPVRVAVSDDGAQSFSAPVDVTPQATDANAMADGPSKPVVNSDGSVTVVWRTFEVSGLLQASRSTDRGQTWSAPVNIANVVNTGTSTATHVQPPATDTSQASPSASYPRMVAEPKTGNLYLVYNQGSGGPNPPPGGYQGADHFVSPDSRVYFQRSRDNGVTWSAPKLISDPTKYPGSQFVHTRQPSVSVSPSGRINIVWHSRRHWYQERGERACTHSHIFCEDVRLGDTYYAYSTDGGNSFSPEIRVSDESMNVDVGYDTRPSGYWNFAPESVAVGGDQVLIGWMDSREGNWDTDTQDIYLARVNFNATDADPQSNVDRPDAVSRSVALSQLAYEGGNQGALVAGPRDPAGAGPIGPATRNATAVVIANETDAPGALAGAVLARANPGPVLLSASAGLSAGVKTEVARLRPARAFILGDAAKVSDQLVADLQAAGIPADRIARFSGSDAATAAQIATQMDQRFPAEKQAGLPAYDAAVIANPAGPDAVAAAALAAARRLPVLYVSRDAVPAETAAALTSLNLNKTLVIGGPEQVSEGVAGQVPSATRLGGSDQFATSLAVAAESKARGLPGNVVYVADGAQPMDAALLGAAVARLTGIMLLSKAPLYDTAASAATAASLSPDRLVVVGPEKQAPVATPTPTPTATAPPVRTPGYQIARKRPGLAAKVRPKRDRRKPFRFKTTGRVKLPSGVSRSAGCNGRVRVTVRANRRRKASSSRSAKVKSTCAFKSQVTFKNAKRLGKRRGKLKFRVRYQGNARLKPRQVVRTVRYG